MSSDEDSNAVFTGFWINWDHGRILGATLTLRDSHAVPLVAALAILVTLAGGRSWHICRLMWHSLLRSKESQAQPVRDHRRKQQVMIRNSETAPGAIINFVQEWFPFGGTKIRREGSLKDIFLVLFTLGHWIVFISLAVLVSQIVVGKVVVSKTLESCGQWEPKVDDAVGRTDETNNLFNELQLNKTINSDNYVRACYPQGGSEGRVDCNKFMVKSIPYKISHNQTCPFNATICYPNAKSAIDLVSSNITLAQLGINTKFGNSISLERSSTCSVMDIEYLMTTDFDPAAGFSGTRGYTLYKSAKTGEPFELVFSLRNQFSEDYKLMSFYFPYLMKDELVPLLRPNTTTESELTVILLQGKGIKFLEKTNDPWFTAHQEVEYNIPMPAGWHRYSMDAFVAMITCTEQYRFCSSITNNCSPYRGLLTTMSVKEMASAYASLFGPDGLKTNTTESWDFDMSIILIEQIMQQTALMWSIQQRGQAALQASRYLNNGLQVRLKPEQWKAELEYWFMMALARLQLETLNTIQKPANLDASNAVNMWSKGEMGTLHVLCGRMKFRSPIHTSLSTFGLAMIISISALLLLGSGTVAALLSMPWMTRWKVVEEWRRDDVLMLLEGSKQQVRLNLEKTAQDLAYKEQTSLDRSDTDVEHFTYVAGEKSTREQDVNQFDPFLVGHGG